MKSSAIMKSISNIIDIESEDEDDEEVLPLIRIKKPVVATKVLKPELTKIVQTDNIKEMVGSDLDSRRLDT